MCVCVWLALSACPLFIIIPSSSSFHAIETRPTVYVSRFPSYISTPTILFFSLSLLKSRSSAIFESESCAVLRQSNRSPPQQANGLHTRGGRRRRRRQVVAIEHTAKKKKGGKIGQKSRAGSPLSFLFLFAFFNYKTNPKKKNKIK